MVFVGPILTWFIITKPHQKTDLKTKETLTQMTQTDVVAKNLKIYQTLIDDIDAQHEKRYKEIKKQHQIEIIEITKKHHKVLQELHDEYKNEINKLRQLINKEL